MTIHRHIRRAVLILTATCLSVPSLAASTEVEQSLESQETIAQCSGAFLALEELFGKRNSKSNSKLVEIYANYRETYTVAALMIMRPHLKNSNEVADLTRKRVTLDQKIGRLETQKKLKAEVIAGVDVIVAIQKISDTCLKEQNTVGPLVYKLGQLPASTYKTIVGDMELKGIPSN